MENNKLTKGKMKKISETVFEDQQAILIIRRIMGLVSISEDLENTIIKEISPGKKYTLKDLVAIIIRECVGNFYPIKFEELFNGFNLCREEILSTDHFPLEIKEEEYKNKREEISDRLKKDISRYEIEAIKSFMDFSAYLVESNAILLK